MTNSVGGALFIFLFVSTSSLIILILHCAGDECSYLGRRWNEKCYDALLSESVTSAVRHPGHRITYFETDSDNTVHIEAKLTVLRRTALYPVPDCPFRQDSYRRMASVLGRGSSIFSLNLKTKTLWYVWILRCSKFFWNCVNSCKPSPIFFKTCNPERF